TGPGAPPRSAQVRLGRCRTSRGHAMSAVAVLRLPLAVDLSGFVKLLQRMQVPHRVSEEAGEQVLWVPDSISDDVRSLYERFPAGDPDQQLDIPVADATIQPGHVEQFRYSTVPAVSL